MSIHVLQRTGHAIDGFSGFGGVFRVSRLLSLAVRPGGIMRVGPQADRFGALLMAKLRDAAIDHADALLAGHWKAPGLQPLQADLGRLTPEQRAVVRRCVIEAVDRGLHDFLFALSEEYDAGVRMAVVVDGQDVAAQSDGLHGKPYGEEGWFARYSKHGPHPDPA